MNPPVESPMDTLPFLIRQKARYTKYAIPKIWSTVLNDGITDVRTDSAKNEAKSTVAVPKNIPKLSVRHLGNPFWLAFDKLIMQFGPGVIAVVIM